MKLRYLLLLTYLSTSLGLTAQERGINWIQDRSWDQVKDLAKRSNKYIFLDCYTTWCTPCKQMDKFVYVNDTVGWYFNDRFICVRVQMDKTEKDNQWVRAWHHDAAEIAKKYWVEGYPTYIFLSSDARIVHKGSGYRDASSLIQLANEAIQPGKTFDHKYFVYDSLIATRNDGKKEYQHYPFLITMAAKSNNGELCGSLLKELSDYISGLRKSKRYTRDRIEMWTGLDFAFSSSSRVFKFFYNDGKLIDNLMNVDGYAASFIDKTIQAETVIPFIEEQSRSSGRDVTEGYRDISGNRLLKANKREAEWRRLFKVLNAKYTRYVAERNLLKAKVVWYKMHRNYNLFAKNKLALLRKYPVGDLTKWREAFELNEFAWEVFINITDKDIIRKTSESMEVLFKQHSVQNVQMNLNLMYDTYANLLYKLGDREKAIIWQQKAINAAVDGWASQREGYIEALENMKKGQPTYVNQGVLWEN